MSISLTQCLSPSQPLWLSLGVLSCSVLLRQWAACVFNTYDRHHATRPYRECGFRREGELTNCKGKHSLRL